MENLKLIIKGILIGIANVIPGVSGGTIAVSMGIYDKIIHAVNNILKEFKKSMKLLIPLGIGIVLAFLCLSKVIDFCFRNYEVNTTIFFVGLILGALPMLIKKVKGTRINVTNSICFIIGFAVIIGMALVSDVSDSNVFPTKNPIVLLVVGAIASATMIIPGISGSLMLAILGFYRPIISTVSDFISKLIAFNFSQIWGDVLILTFVGIGVIIGIVVFAKIIEFLFNRYEVQTFYTIIGIIVASPIALLVNLNFAGLNFINYILMVLFAGAGFYFAVLLGEK